MNAELLRNPELYETMNRGKEYEESKEPMESKEPKESKESKESKEFKESKDIKESIICDGWKQPSCIYSYDHEQKL